MNLCQRFSEERAVKLMIGSLEVFQTLKITCKQKSKIAVGVERGRAKLVQGCVVEAIKGALRTPRGRQRSVFIEADKPAFQVEFEFVPARNGGELSVFNYWTRPDGLTQSFLGNAGMLIEQVETSDLRRRSWVLRCSDGFNGVNFENVKITVTLTESAGDHETTVNVDPDEPPEFGIDNLRHLFLYLNTQHLAGVECAHDFTLTKKFLRQNNLEIDLSIEWLSLNGAGCDCEVMYNVEEKWGERAGYVAPDADE